MRKSCLLLPKVISIMSQQVLSFKTCQILFTPTCCIDIFLSMTYFPKVVRCHPVFMLSLFMCEHCFVFVGSHSTCYRQLEVILARRYHESVTAQISRHYLTLCSCVLDITVSTGFGNGRLSQDLILGVTRKHDSIHYV